MKLNIYWKNFSGSYTENRLYGSNIKTEKQLVRDDSRNSSSKKWWNSVSISAI